MQANIFTGKRLISTLSYEHWTLVLRNKNSTKGSYCKWNNKPVKSHCCKKIFFSL